MALNVSQKLIQNHILEGELKPGTEIAIKIDQTLTQDATGTMVMLEFESLGIDSVRTELSAQYVDHNLLQEDNRNPDDHLFLRSACQKYGIWFSKPGNGVSHPLHMERFGAPGKSLLGSDSHTCAAGSMGMLAIGAGGLEVAMAMAGQPFYMTMPKITGVKLSGKLPDWVSAKDVILEMLRRHGVDGGVGKIFEYYGPGLDTLTAMDRHVIANMGAELGATTSVFPADSQTQSFLATQTRAEAWTELTAGADAEYDEHDEINLSTLEPLIALPSSPGNVVPVREVEGKEIYQAYIGSSANPGLRDFAIPALMVDDRQVQNGVSFDINPASRQILENLIHMGFLSKLVHSGARIHQAGCNGCIGMGQAPATGRISLRTVPRNFPGRSGTKGDAVYLCSPETAAASALKGCITDPRSLDFPYPKFSEPKEIIINTAMFLPPLQDRKNINLEKGPNIGTLPVFEAIPDQFEGPALLKLENDISTDEIMPAGAKTLPYRSNIKAISQFVFRDVDPMFKERAGKAMNGFFIVAGENYGQGSSREHAALAPRYLGLRVVLAKSFARIHFQNLINFGILPLIFVNPDDWRWIEKDHILAVENIHQDISQGTIIKIHNKTNNKVIDARHSLSNRQKKCIASGSLMNTVKETILK